jgi:hypothetical protein
VVWGPGNDLGFAGPDEAVYDDSRTGCIERGSQLLAIEVKLSQVVNDRDVRHLIWLRDALGENLTDAMIITTGPRRLPAPRRHRSRPGSATRTLTQPRRPRHAGQTVMV